MFQSIKEFIQRNRLGKRQATLELFGDYALHLQQTQYKDMTQEEIVTQIIVTNLPYFQREKFEKLLESK